MPHAVQVNPAKPVYYKLMKTFIAANGREVVEVETPEGVTVAIDTTIPRDALQAIRNRMDRKQRLLERFRVGQRPESLDDHKISST